MPHYESLCTLMPLKTILLQLIWYFFLLFCSLKCFYLFLFCWFLYHIKDKKFFLKLSILVSILTWQTPAILTGLCRHFISTVCRCACRHTDRQNQGLSTLDRLVLTTIYMLLWVVLSQTYFNLSQSVCL